MLPEESQWEYNICYAKGSELKQELGARTGESVHDRAVRLMYSAFVANFVTVLDNFHRVSPS